MNKKYVKVKFDLSNSKKRNVTVNNIDEACTDESMKELGNFVANFIEGTKREVIKVVETVLS